MSTPAVDNVVGKSLDIGCAATVEAARFIVPDF
jgi:hypothetical protein